MSIDWEGCCVEKGDVAYEDMGVVQGVKGANLIFGVGVRAMGLGVILEDKLASHVQPEGYESGGDDGWTD